MSHLLIHLAQTSKIVEVFACCMQMRVEIMDNPGSRKDPVFKALVVITVYGIRCQNTVENGSCELRPLRCVINFVVKRISSDAKASHRNECMVLAIGISLSRFRLDVVVHE